MQESDAELTDVVLAASRALVAVAARSLSSVQDDVTLPQYRAVVILTTKGPTTMGALAEALACSASTATRLCDRLEVKGLLTRRLRDGNRREVEVQATRAGGELVRAVTDRRRADIEAIVGAIPQTHRTSLVRGLRAFAEAAGEAPDQPWATGWDL